MSALESQPPAPLRAAARKRAMNFSWETAARETLALYEKVLEPVMN